MKVQEYLHEIDRTYADANITALDKLRIDFGIRAVQHEQLPLVILNYSQIDSPKSHPIVRECRGLVLEMKTWKLVARSFPRFFNWGEMAEEMSLFDFNDCHARSKEDGSLVLLYCYQGQWRVNTRGSFADGKMQPLSPTWEEGIRIALGVHSLQGLKRRLFEELTYVCEFCSPWNKVVRRYATPRLYLLTAFEGEKEMRPGVSDMAYEADNLFSRPQRFDFRSIEEVQKYIENQASKDPTYEGVVLCDKDYRRWKVKSPTYLGLHRLANNGEFTAKHLLPFVLAGDADELLQYYPECKDVYQEIEARTKEAYGKLSDLWDRTRGIEGQKEFALAIVGKTPFTGALFTARKTGAELAEVWRENPEMILKHLF